MLRCTIPTLSYRPRGWIQRVMPLLPGKAKVEFKFARGKVLNRLKTATLRRKEIDAWTHNDTVKVAVGAAANEHGTSWAALTADLARQNVTLFPTAQRAVAVYEPMSFRALMELAGSGIAPPTPKASVPKPQLAPAAQLDVDVAALQRTKSAALAADRDLRDAWKRYVDPSESR